MKLPIAYALMGEVQEPLLERVDLVRVGSLEFREIQKERYPLWELKADLLANPQRGVIVNAANEIAIERFVCGEISFGALSTLILKTYSHFSQIPHSVDELFAIDEEVRAYTRALR
jgi:1-deoxy-D-xylulose-5-phosphate reductoisomerase